MSSSNNVKKHGHISNAQKEMMIDFLENHPKLRSGKFDATFTYKSAVKLWEELATKLNAIPGAEKDGKTWRKTWQDLRGAVKTKASAIRNHMSGTVGGQRTPAILTPLEEKIKDLIGDTQISGHVDVPETSTLFELPEDGEEPVVLTYSGGVEDTGDDIESTVTFEETAKRGNVSVDRELPIHYY